MLCSPAKRCLNKLFHARVVLAAGRRFDARCDVDGPELSGHSGDGFADVVGGQASGENQRPGEVRGSGPIICRAIDQDGFGGIVGHVGRGVFDAEGFPDADGAGMLRGCFVAVELRDIESEAARRFVR